MCPVYKTYDRLVLCYLLLQPQYVQTEPLPLVRWTDLLFKMPFPSLIGIRAIYAIKPSNREQTSRDNTGMALAQILKQVSKYTTQPTSHAYFLVGPLTPAPITLGSSSLPMLYNIPIPLLTRKTSTTVDPANNQNGTTTSFF